MTTLSTDAPAPTRAAPGTAAARTPEQLRNVYWILGLSCLALVFDGYDIVVFGTVVTTLLNDPTQLGALTIQQTGNVASLALIGVMIGALLAGAVGDHLGRRKIVLGSIAWFSIGMALTAMATNIQVFGALRLVTGLGLGALLATLGALVAEFAPTDKKNLFNALVYSGIPAGGVLASVTALVFLQFGWRGLFWLGATPILYLLPLAWKKIPESPKWLEAKGRHEEARAVSAHTGVELEAIDAQLEAEAHTEKVGFAGLFGGRFAVPTILLGCMSFSGLLLTYGLTTWLPKIMGDYGYGKEYSLVFLLLLNVGAVLGGLAAAYLADRFFGPKATIVTTFLLAGLMLVAMTFRFPTPILFAAIFVAGIGTLGTQVLIYGKVSNYYTTKTRAAGVAWCAGFGRLGGIVGPIGAAAILSALAGSGSSGNTTAFYFFAGVALFGAVVCLLVPAHAAEKTRV